MKYGELSQEEERICKAIVNAAFTIHKGIGPGNFNVPLIKDGIRRFRN
jgi:hypothetical protein